jgi:DNA repair protein RadC
MSTLATPQPRDDLPRERLTRHGPAVLGDTELIALLLGSGRRGDSARTVADRILQEHGGLLGLAMCGPEELARTRGVGAAKAAAILAALEVGRRVATRRLERGSAIRSPEDVFEHFHSSLRLATQERFVIVLLDGRHRVCGESVVSQGTLTASLVHPREVFRPALRAGAAALVLVHNHPSGDPSPSREDREITERLVRAGVLLGVSVLDHVIVAERGYCSLREEGMLEWEPEAEESIEPS